jgi:hypothetical protein
MMTKKPNLQQGHREIFKKKLNPKPKENWEQLYKPTTAATSRTFQIIGDGETQQKTTITNPTIQFTTTKNSTIQCTEITDSKIQYKPCDRYSYEPKLDFMRRVLTLLSFTLQMVI